MASKLLTVLNLSEQERLQTPPILSKLKTVQEWLSDATEAVKDVSDFSETLQKLSPLAAAGFEATKEVLPPVKFVLKVFQELTKVQEPEALAQLACTLAYQKAVQEAFKEEHPESRPGTANLRESFPDTDSNFGSFTLQQALSHPFVHHADRVVEFFAPKAGYSRQQVTGIITKIHDRFPDELQQLIAHGETKEKFDPLWRWLQLDPEGRAARAALRRHAEYTEWAYRKAPVLEREPYALEHIYVETECSKLTRAQLQVERAGETKPNPFAEGEKNGGRYPLLETVLNYIQSPKFRDAIVIQGTAGSGKSSFTLRLAAALREEGLRPIRIRLRDVNVMKDFFSGLGEALALEDEIYLRGNSRWPDVQNVLLRGAIFQDEVPYLHENSLMYMCPHVLILDGWDEISVAVSEGYKQRVKELLMNVRRELLKPYGRIVRVILTGRPSDAIDDCADFFLPDTPVLTLRLLRPYHLTKFAVRLRGALEIQPVQSEDTVGWTMPSYSELQPVFEAYERDFAKHEPERTDAVAVIGTPFLAQLAFRLMSDWQGNKGELIGDRTTLMRSLVDFVTRHAHCPSDRISGTRIMPRFSGSGLRNLLHCTAAQITAYGKESIPKAELEERLNTDQLELTIREINKEHVISGLIVSFYFKGGNPALGCEFTHKAFREYLFAEAIVEALKNYGRRITEVLPEREPYWKDFDSDIDPRGSFSEEIAALIAPHWLAPEVIVHLENLLQWEIGRDLREGETNGVAGCTDPLDFGKWRVVRDGLADLWDWWAEGVHMRMQPRREKGQIEWRPSRVQNWVRDRAPREPLDRRFLPTPIRFNTLDAHLGYGLLRLNAWVHGFIKLGEHGNSASSPVRNQVARRFQSLDENHYIRFRPSGGAPQYFTWYLARINSAGWLPDTSALGSMFLSRINLEGTNLEGVDLHTANLREADLSRTVLRGANLEGTNLEQANLRVANLHTANLIGANLRGADLSRTVLWRADLSGAILSGAILWRADLREADLSRADLSGANLIGANLWGTDLRKANLSRADLRETKNLNQQQIDSAICDHKTKLPPGLNTPLRAKSTSP
jgi:uncharacterized protein YjbI with pentapeptide repeats